MRYSKKTFQKSFNFVVANRIAPSASSSLRLTTAWVPVLVKSAVIWKVPAGPPDTEGVAGTAIRSRVATEGAVRHSSECAVKPISTHQNPPGQC